MLSCVYGSSEYAQGFSRTGSIHGNIYIVNEEVDIKQCNFVAASGQKEETTEGINAKKVYKCDSVEFSYNGTPLTPRKGFLVGSDYQEWFLK